MISLLRRAIVLICLAVLGGMPLALDGLLQSGPMVGYSAMKEVMLWVQTREAATVQVAYWPKEQPGDRHLTAAVTTGKAMAFTAHLLADQVTPGTRYTYELLINGEPVPLAWPLEFQTQALWQFRTDPPAFRFATGSCAYINEAAADRPGKPYGGEYEIFTAIQATRPDFMLWLGDNNYLREPDLDSRTGILYRNTHTRSLPELQPLLGSTHHYAIWDDHDYGPNDSDRGYAYKTITAEAFRLFWANPNYNLTGQGGITGMFTWADTDFFLLDDRWFRTPNNRHTGDRVILGDAQIQWLIDVLSYSRAPFKFIAFGGQVLNPSALFENYATYPEERRKLLDAIAAAHIPGVIFLTGDRHHTELMRLERPGTYPLYELTCSPFTSTVYAPMPEEGAIRVEGTLVNERNFAILEVAGPRRDRALTIRVYDARGKELWARTIKARELR